METELETAEMDGADQPTEKVVPQSPFMLAKVLLNILCAFSLIGMAVLFSMSYQYGVDSMKDLIQLVIALSVFSLPFFARYMVHRSDARSGSKIHSSLAGWALLAFTALMFVFPTPALLLMAALAAWSSFLCFGLLSVSGSFSKGKGGDANQ